MSENSKSGNCLSVSGRLRVGAPDTIPKGDRLTDAQVEQVRELLAQEREALAQEREGMLTAIGEAVGKLLDRQLERIESFMEARGLEIAALERRLAEIRDLVASDGATVIDGTPVSTRRNVN